MSSGICGVRQFECQKVMDVPHRPFAILKTSMRSALSSLSSKLHHPSCWSLCVRFRWLVCGWKGYETIEQNIQSNLDLIENHEWYFVWYHCWPPVPFPGGSIHPSSKIGKDWIIVPHPDCKEKVHGHQLDSAAPNKLQQQYELSSRDVIYHMLSMSLVRLEIQFCCSSFTLAIVNVAWVQCG